MRRKAILPRVLALTAGIRDFDKHLFDSHTLDSSDSGAQPHCPAYLRFQNVSNQQSDSGYDVYRKRRIPRR